MSRRIGLVLVVFTALALGYVVGVGRTNAPDGRALAGPSWIDGSAVAGTQSGTWIAADADGSTLTLWTLKDGNVVRAKRSYFHDAKTTTADFTVAAPGK